MHGENFEAHSQAQLAVIIRQNSASTGSWRSFHAAAANARGQALRKLLTLGAVGLPLKEPTLIPSDSMLPPSSCSGVAFFMVMLTYLQDSLQGCSAEGPAAAQRVE